MKGISGRAKRRRLGDALSLRLMLLPAIIIVILYCYAPMGGLVMAFQKFTPAKSFLGSPWVGLDNFRMLFKLPTFWRAFRNTLLISVAEIALGQILAIALAVLLNEARRNFFAKAVQTIIYLPHFLSWVIVGGIFLDIFGLDGLINNWLTGLGGTKIYFMGTPVIFPWMLIFAHLWKEVGFATIVYLASMASIDSGLYEAASIDGAGRMAQIRNITLPGIKTTIILVAILNLGSILSVNADQVLVMYNSLVYSTGDIIDTLVYRLGLQQTQYSIAAAAGIFKSVVSLILVATTYYAAYRAADYKIF